MLSYMKHYIAWWAFNQHKVLEKASFITSENGLLMVK